MFDSTPTRRARPSGRDVSALRAYQLFFVVHCAGFIALVASEADHGLRTILHLLGVGGAGVESLGLTQVFAHPFLHLSPLEFAVTVGLLLALGGEVERALGSIRFTILYLASGAGVGLLYGAIAILGHDGVPAPPLPFVGGIGAGAALVSAYVLLEPRRRVLGTIPAPGFFVLVTGLLVATTIYLDGESQRHTEALLAQTLTDKFTPDSWLDRQYELTSRTTPLTPHLLGFVVGAVFFAIDLACARCFAFVRMRRDIRILEEELEARARVEQLLEKISRDGLQALSWRERKFLQYASRFYPPGQVLSDG